MGIFLSGEMSAFFDVTDPHSHPNGPKFTKNTIKHDQMIALIYELMSVCFGYENTDGDARKS